MKIDLGSLIYVLGAMQALLLLIGINLKRPFQSDTKILISLLLGAMLIVMVMYAIFLNGYFNLFPHLDSLSSAAWMAIPPLYYLLFMSVHDPKWQLQWRHLVYFPVSAIFWLEGILTTLGMPVYIGQLTGPYIDFSLLWTLSFFALGYFFSIKTIVVYRKHANWKPRGFLWFSYVFVGILVVFSVLYAIWFDTSLVLLELVLIAHFEVFVFVLVFRSFKLLPERRFFARNKYEQSPTSDTDMRTQAGRLEALMEEQKPFLNPKLTLNQLAEISGLRENALSQLFAHHYQSSFYDFVNQYRLVHVEQLISNPAKQNLTLMALAEESGFNSKTTFYKVFKQKHQMTPAQFARSQRSKPLGVG